MKLFSNFNQISYKINPHLNIYGNVGVLSIAPKFNNVFNGNQIGNKVYEDAKNQIIYSQEIGAGIIFKPIAANLNIY